VVKTFLQRIEDVHPKLNASYSSPPKQAVDASAMGTWMPLSLEEQELMMYLLKKSLKVIPGSARGTPSV